MWFFSFAVEYQYSSWRQPWDSLLVKEVLHAGEKFALYLKVMNSLCSTAKECIEFEVK